VITEALRHRQHELAKQRAPFVTATVVQVQHPTSAERGDVALVTADGALEGFVGGACARDSVRIYSLQALERGEPLLLRIMPDPEQRDPESLTMSDGQEIASDEGSITVRNPCLSGGSIEVFLEPTLPAPRVLVTGESPIANSLASLGPAIGLEIVATAGVRGAKERVCPAPGDLALVVASHGRDELEPLREAIESDIPYIGLVASRKRGAEVLADLQNMGLDPAAIDRIESPAGIDIGATTASEVALSILARVVAVRRGAAAAAPVQAAPQTAVDPICGMTVVIDADTPTTVRDGEASYFCCDGCQRSFAQQLG
jgi:xanthine dehydrogenase accessory factor